MGVGMGKKLMPRLVGCRILTSAGFQGVGPKGKDVGREARLEECSLVGRRFGLN